MNDIIKSASTPPTTTAFPPIPDAKRDSMLAQMVNMLIRRGDEFGVITRICKDFSRTKFVTPFVPAEVERKVLAIVNSTKLKADMAETNIDKVVSKLNEKFVWLSGPMAIYNLKQGSIVKKEALKSHYANTCVVVVSGGKDKRMTHFDAWMQSPQRREHIDLDFVPGGASIVNDHINIWQKWAVTPKSGDASPWSALLDHLFGAGTSERCWFEQWCAYPIQNPGAKLHAAVVIWSTQEGVGKTLIAQTVGKLYGNHFRTITGKMLRSKYNGWAHDALMVLGEEKDCDQRADTEMMKTLVTGDVIQIEEKYRTSFECGNRMNFIFTSNHPDAFHLAEGDRRHFVWSVAAAAKEAAFYDTYGAWLKSEAGLSALMDHLLNLDLTGFDPHARPPMTRAKLDMIERSKSDLDLWLTDALTDEYIDGCIGREIVQLSELVRLYQQDTGSVRTTPKAMGLALRRHCDYAQVRISIRALRPPVVTVRNHAYWAMQDTAAWTAEYKKASPAFH
jgi:hypothetical protein